MIRKPVVFVVGAGASHEYGLPLGGTLKETIAEKLRAVSRHGDLLSHIQRHVGRNQKELGEYIQAATALAKTIKSFISIDEALHYVGATPKAVEIGKVAIVHEILRAERESALCYEQTTGALSVNGVDGLWISEALSMIVAGIQREELAAAFDQVTFINFNYDRAIEQYLYWALQQRMLAEASEAKQIIEALKIIRPYGSIGRLAFSFGDEYGYGTTAYFDPFSRIQNMRTYTEQDRMHDAEAMEQALHAARIVIFLGFGYHTTNVDLMKINQRTNYDCRVLGTSKGVHQANISRN
jgi:hypothetical protein